MWASEISDSAVLRFFVAVAGGIFLGIGSRWADGCTSGHGISGTSLLSVISWVASIAFFMGGIAVAGAIGNGYMDALTGGFIGMVLGTIIYAMMYEKLKARGVLTQDKYSEYSLFHKITGNPFKVTLPIGAALVLAMYIMEIVG